VTMVTVKAVGQLPDAIATTARMPRTRRADGAL